MDVTFGDQDLKDLCESQRLAKRQLGPDCAQRLFARLADLRAAASVNRLPAGKPHPLKGQRSGQYAVSLTGGMRLVIEPDHKPVPRRADGGPNWDAVSKLKVVEIGNYHD